MYALECSHTRARILCVIAHAFCVCARARANTIKQLDVMFDADKFTARSQCHARVRAQQTNAHAQRTHTPAERTYAATAAVAAAEH